MMSAAWRIGAKNQCIGGVHDTHGMKRKTVSIVNAAKSGVQIEGLRLALDVI